MTIVLVSVTALAIGYVAGPEDPHERAALAIECGVRHPGLSIAIASATLTQARALPVMVPCALMLRSTCRSAHGCTRNPWRPDRRRAGHERGTRQRTAAIGAAILFEENEA
jgi:hypothetical protein